MIKLRNLKIWVGNKPELCRKIQKYLFNNGCTWWTGNSIMYEDSDALYIGYSGILTFSKDEKKPRTRT